MNTGPKQPFNVEKGQVPMDGVLCFFGTDTNPAVIDGWLGFCKFGHFIQERKSWKRHDPKEFTNYHEILNDKEGFIICDTAPVEKCTCGRELHIQKLCSVCDNDE